MKKINFFLTVLATLSLPVLVFAGEIELDKTAGDVKIISSGNPLGLPAEQGARLSLKDKIETGPNSSATVKIDKQATVTLGSQTTWAIQEYNDVKDNYRFSAELTLGKLEAKVKKLPKGGNFDIRTPTSIASVRGTRFGLNVYRQNGQLFTRLAVFDDSVFFSNLQGLSGQNVNKNQGSAGNESGKVTSPETLGANEKENNFLSNVSGTSSSNTTSIIQVPTEDTTQGEFALWLIKEMDALSKLPAAAKGEDAILLLMENGIIPPDGWKADEKISKAFLGGLLGLEKGEAEKLTFAELVERVKKYIASHFSQRNLGVFRANSSASGSTAL